MISTYKLNEDIHVSYQAVGAETGIIDMMMDVFDTNGNSISGFPIVMTDIGNGLYEGIFIPTSVGIWRIKITSSSAPENGQEAYYKVTLNGKVEVSIPASADSITVNLIYEKIDSIAVNADEWQDAIFYTVPSGYTFNAISFSGVAGSNNNIVRAIKDIHLATFDMSTDVFTEIASISVPAFYSQLYVLVTDAIGNQNTVTTITYVNEYGITGRTAIVAISKSISIGSRIKVELQSGDNGVTEITNVTNTVTQSGFLILEGNLDLFYEYLGESNTQKTASSVALGGIIALENEVIALQYNPPGVNATSRRITLIGSLVPNG